MIPNDQELMSILDELENDLGEYLESTKLAKAREEDGSAPADSASPEASAEPSADAPPASAEPSAPAPDASAAPSPEAPPASPEAAPEDPAADQGPIDPAALEAEYAKLPPEELKAHYLAAKAALFAVMGAGAGPDAGASAPPAGPEGAAPAGPSAPPAGPSAPPAGPPAGPEGAPPMDPNMALKSEVPAGKNVEGVSQSGNGGQKATVAKSEDDQKVKQLTESVERLQKALVKIVGQPLQKAVTAQTYVPKTGDVLVEKKNLSKAEVTAKLSEVTRREDLKKSDRALVNRYYEGSVGLEAIEHLLK